MSHKINRAKDNTATNKTKFLSVPKPNGIKLIKPPKATFVFEAPSLAAFNKPKIIMMKPIRINNTPKLINCSIFKGMFFIG